jgi:hypothetical protein
MADFATLALAEARVVAKIADKTWINGFACRQTVGGKFAVRVQRPMSAASAGSQAAGGWVELTDDGAV